MKPRLLNKDDFVYFGHTTSGQSVYAIHASLIAPLEDMEVKQLSIAHKRLKAKFSQVKFHEIRGIILVIESASTIAIQMNSAYIANDLETWRKATKDKIIAAGFSETDADKILSLEIF